MVFEMAQLWKKIRGQPPGQATQMEEQRPAPRQGNTVLLAQHQAHAAARCVQLTEQKITFLASPRSTVLDSKWAIQRLC